MHDNARAHTAAEVRDYLFAVAITIIELSARSSDMNPMGNLWDEQKTRIRGSDPTLETLGQLRNVIQVEWENISHHVVVTLIRLMINRIEAVIRARGGDTSY